MIMYFNSEKADTNIDKEIDKKENKQKIKNIDFKNVDKKKIFIIGGIVIFLLILLIVIISVTTSKSKINIQVIGGNNIKVYQGSKYFDPGFSATDKKGNNINDKAVVYNPVDTSKIDKYIVTYTIGEYRSSRTVEVVERPSKGITYIALQGKKDMDISKGDKYTEPGYVAIDDIDGNITDKVNISGSVNYNREGTYKLVYYVVNSTGITTTIERTVNVK